MLSIVVMTMMMNDEICNIICNLFFLAAANDKNDDAAQLI